MTNYFSPAKVYPIIAGPIYIEKKMFGGGIKVHITWKFSFKACDPDPNCYKETSDTDLHPCSDVVWGSVKLAYRNKENNLDQIYDLILI